MGHEKTITPPLGAICIRRQYEKQRKCGVTWVVTDQPLKVISIQQCHHSIEHIHVAYELRRSTRL